jgi:leucine dehydrogenase
LLERLIINCNEDVHGAILQERGIYISDFLINAGGIINVYAELAHYDERKL